MNILRLSGQVPPGMGEALAEFESGFSYPLGSSGRFRISHGADYLPFFRAMGEPEVLMLEDGGSIQGGLARVQRSLELREGQGTTRRIAHYLCDLKLRTAARGSLVLPRLIRATKQAIESSASVCCYCVVMEGTGKLPTDYTGRLGVPRFEKLGEIAILRIEAGGEAISADLSPAEFEKLRAAIAPQGFSAPDADASLRSLMEPLPLAIPSGDACGIVEDTRRGKRLFLESGEEMVSAHLSRFACATPRAGAALLRMAAARAGALGMPAMFVAVPQREAAEILSGLAGLKVLLAPAVVYGHALEPGHDWWIDTAEI
ncbi:N-acetyltransferase [Luteolibacter sp. Populi]|uniref:N-acetyltransferase n=1 Tax=Luteolibacter sp. Populi TaxID=3230487 RepID=UPI003466FA90